MKYLFTTTLLLVTCFFTISLHATIHSGTLNGLIDINYPKSYDLNNDGTEDVQMASVRISSNYCVIRVYARNGSKVETVSSGNVKAYNLGDMLGTGIYKDSGTISLSDFGPGAQGNFMGLKISINGTLCCSYIEVSPDINYAFIRGACFFGDYGYETNSNVCITAGISTAVAGPVSSSSLPVIIPNPSAATAYLLLPEAGEYRVVAVNAMGQIMLALAATMDENSKGKPIPLKGLPHGAYIINIMCASQRYLLRCIIE
jgi:hypothetical protein